MVVDCVCCLARLSSHWVLERVVHVATSLVAFVAVVGLLRLLAASVALVVGTCLMQGEEAVVVVKGRGKLEP